MKNIPIITITEKCLAAAYEKALVALYNYGISFKTQYDKVDDPPSLDCTMNLTIEDPLSEPMIHKAFPGGIEDLREYVMEIQGVKDHWVKNINDPNDTRWEYTYHQRLASYGSWNEIHDGKSEQRGYFNINQIENVISKLVKQPFTRQAQMITWMPNLDIDCYDPPCLQSLWYRIAEDENNVGWLNCNIRFRSNDAWGANFMNMFGFTMFNKEIIASEVSKRLNKEIKLGRLNWQADSYHIYGKDIEAVKMRLFDRLEKTSFAERVYNFSDENIKSIYDESTDMILEKISKYDQSH
jgi:thymidylate synthase